MWKNMKIVADTASSFEDVKQKLQSQTPDGALDPKNIINYLLYAGGIVAVVMIIISGIQMTTSGGDPGAVKKAKNTLVMSIVGLLVMILAYAIVNFVVEKVT